MAELIWRAERACAAAWPAIREERVGEWIVRLSAGPTRRINAASPSCQGAALSPDDLAAIEAIYCAARQPVILRVPTFAGGADAVLDRLASPRPKPRPRRCMPSYPRSPAARTSRRMPTRNG